MKKRVLSMLMALIMVFSLMPTTVFAVGTAEDPYDIGDVVISDTAPTDVVIPENTEWISSTITVVTEDVICTNVEEGHVHSAEANCYATAEKTQWTLTEKAVEITSEDKTHVEGCTLAADHEGDCVVEEQKQCESGCTLEAGHEGDCYVCEEGCILTGEAEHAENGWECLVWTACTLTEGCELMAGHEGECTGASVFATRNLQIRVTYNNNGVGGLTVTLKDANGVVVAEADTSDSRNSRGYVTFNGLTVGEVYTVEINDISDGYTYTATQEITIGSGSSTQSATVATSRTYDATAYAKSRYDDVSYFDHVDIRVGGTYTTGTTDDLKTHNIIVTNCRVNVVNPTNTNYNFSADHSGDTTEDYEWRSTGKRIYKDATVTVYCDIYYDVDKNNSFDSSVDTLAKKDYVTTFSGEAAFIQAIINCDGRQGLDFILDPQDIIEAIYYNVNYQWKVDNGDGTYSDMPTSLATVPTDTKDYAPNDEHTVDATKWKDGYYVIDETNGKLYTFHGWDTWSHNSAFGVDASADGYNAVGATVTITDDTYINGYWTVTTLAKAESHVTIVKKFMDNDGNLLDTNLIPADWHIYLKGPLGGESPTYLSQFTYNATTGEWTLEMPIYRDGTYTVEEHSYAIDGYTSTRQVMTVSELNNQNHDHISAGEGSVEKANTSFTLSLDWDVDGTTPCDDVAKVQIDNYYSKVTGEAVHVYPSLYVHKVTLETPRLDLAGASFTLTKSGAASGTTKVTNNNGLAIFTELQPGTYTLRETAAPAGYVLDPHAYTVTVAVKDGFPEERLMNGAYVQYYEYDVDVTSETTIPEYNTADRNALVVENEEIVGELTIIKDVQGDLNESTLDKTIKMTVTYDANNNGVVDADETGTEIQLNKANNWTVTLENLELGKYIITETDYTVDGYNVTADQAGTTAIAPVVVDIAAGTDAVTEKSAVITNWYYKDYADPVVNPTNLNVVKYRTGTNVKLEGAVFKLTNLDTNASQQLTTNANGEIAITGLNAAGKYLLEEITAPAQHKLNEKKFYILVTENVTETQLAEDGGKFQKTYTYDAIVYEDAGFTDELYIKENDAGDTIAAYSNTDNTLEVYNDRTHADLTIRKVFPPSNAVDVTEVTFEITKNGSVVQTVVMNRDKNTADTSDDLADPVDSTQATVWTQTIELELGEYTVTEKSIKYMDGAVEASANVGIAQISVGNEMYYWVVSGNPETIHLTATSEDAAVEIDNSFTKQNPVEIQITKTDGTNPLAGAIFSIYNAKSGTNGYEIDGAALATAISSEEGLVVFSGFVTANKTYIIKETTAPTYYNGSDDQWLVQVSTNEDKVVVEVTNMTTSAKVDNGAGNVVSFEVENTLKTADLALTKSVTYNMDGNELDAAEIEALDAATKAYINGLADDTYTFNLHLTGTARAPLANQTFNVTGVAGVTAVTTNAQGIAQLVLKAGDTAVVEGLPYGVFYTVEEVHNGTGYAVEVSANRSGVVNDNIVTNGAIAVGFNNVYNFTTVTPGISGTKNDSITGEAVEGAVFTLYKDDVAIASDISEADGYFWLPITEVGTSYVVKETVSPEGYHDEEVTRAITAEYKFEIVNPGLDTSYIRRILVASADTVSGEVKLDSYNEMNVLSGNVVVNSIIVANTPIKTVEITAEKVWDDEGYYARPDSVKVILQRAPVNGDESAYIDYLEAVLNDANGWKYTWNNLTDEYKWRIVEKNVADVEALGYSSVVTAGVMSDSDENLLKQQTFTITNTRAPKQINITVEKDWNHNYSDNKKLNEEIIESLPDSITVNLYKEDLSGNKTLVGSEVLNDENNWEATWENLFDNFKYFVEEVEVPGYTAEYSEGEAPETTGTVSGVALKITNTRIIKMISVGVEKIWEEVEDYTDTPESVEIVLKQDGEEFETIVLSEKNDWKFTWDNLSDFYNWTVDEINVPEGYEKTVVSEGNNWTVTNKLVTEAKDLTVTKKWIVPEGYTDIPESIEVQLYRDGEKYGDAVKLSKENNWTTKWEGLYDCFVWEVKEVEIPEGYDSEIITEDGWSNTIVNVLDYDYVKVSVSKIWLNPKDYTEQPTSIAVVLYRDGVAYETVTLSESNSWSYKWTDLPDCFEWTVDEPNVPTDYAKKITHIGNAWVITNAHKDIPLTGDDSNVMLWAGATGVAVVGLGASLFLLLKKRKEEDEQA